MARARYIEEMVAEQAAAGIAQYVILGAGLDTFAQRRGDLASRMQVFEIDQPGTQAWKRQRLDDLGYGVPSWLHLVPVDFEAGRAWLDALTEAGFERARPAIVASTGVSMYLTRDAVAALLREVASLAPGSVLAMSYLLPIEMSDPRERSAVEGAARGAAASGTPWLSFFTPEEMLDLAREAGFLRVEHVSGADLSTRYFAARNDGLRPSPSEELLIAYT